jgi:hypothetical protein
MKKSYLIFSALLIIVLLFAMLVPGHSQWWNQLSAAQRKSSTNSEASHMRKAAFIMRKAAFLPDLDFSIRVVSPPNPTIRDIIKFRCEVKNIGKTKAVLERSIKLKHFLGCGRVRWDGYPSASRSHPDISCTGTSQGNCTSPVLSSIDVGEVVYIEKTFDPFEGFRIHQRILEPGNYELSGIVDHENKIKEQDEMNNLNYRSVYIAPADLPDLVIADVRINPPVLKPPVQFEMIVTVKNQGNGSLSYPARTLGLYVFCGYPARMRLEDLSKPELRPNQSVQLKASGYFTASWTAPEVDVYCTVGLSDNNPDFLESNVDNNTFKATMAFDPS